jgi:hypothetical protein
MTTKKARATNEHGQKRHQKRHLGQLGTTNRNPTPRRFAKSACPVYYSDIIKDWQEMPSEYNDSWQQNGIGTTEETTIFSLMSWDLYFYYESQYNLIFTEIRLDKEQEETEKESESN